MSDGSMSFTFAIYGKIARFLSLQPQGPIASANAASFAAVIADIFVTGCGAGFLRQNSVQQQEMDYTAHVA
jgi:hypothetical protein